MRYALLAAGLTASACADDAGTGTLAITVYGEAFIEEGIPAEAVKDGWRIDFDRFDVTLSDIALGGVTLAGPVTVDLSGATKELGQELVRGSVPAGDHVGGGYTVYKVKVVGKASKASVEKTFDWTFETAVTYRDCEAVVSVPKDGVGTFQLTIHADHYLYDSLVSEEPTVAFDAIAAADADEDGVITQAELAATGIGSFDPGNAAIDDLWEWLVALNATLGHANGEGHCTTN
jgi:hypothetical protein